MISTMTQMTNVEMAKIKSVDIWIPLVLCNFYICIYYKKIEMKMQADIYVLGLRVLYEAGECCMAKMTEKHG